MINTILNRKYFDVIVIGAGPAGASAAFFLASKGVKVLILEKKKFPRHKICGGGVVSRIKKILPFSFENAVEKEFYTVDIFDQSARLHFKTTRSEPIIMMSMRSDLDLFLLSKALEAGAVIKLEYEAKEIVQSDERIEISSNRGNFSGEFLIAADGATGISSKFLGLKDNIIRLPAIEAEVEIDGENYSKLFESPRFDFGIIDKGYAWVFPKRDHLSIGVALMKKDKVNLNEAYRKYLSLLGLTKIIHSEKSGYTIPMLRQTKNFGFGRLLLTGDAAGLADPVTAEGISGSVFSGYLAAKAIIEKRFDVRFVRDFYNLIIHENIIKENRYARIISNLIYSSPQVRAIIFKLYGQRLSEIITDIFTGEKKYSSLMTDPTNYYKLLKYMLEDKNKRVCNPF